MDNVVNLKPNPIHDMIDELVRQKDNIDQMIICFVDKDGTFYSKPACYSYVDAVGMVGIMRENLTFMAHNDEFDPIPRK